MRGMLGAALVLLACGGDAPQARIDVHLSRDPAVAITALDVTAQTATRQGSVHLADVAGFFQDCASAIVHVLVPPGEPARVTVSATLVGGGAIQAQSGFVSASAGQTAAVWLQLGSGAALPDCPHPGVLGDACTVDADCSAPATTCVHQVLSGGSALTFPGGYCSLPCQPGSCPAPALCGSWTDPQSGRTDSYCLKACDTMVDCRSGYHCCHTHALDAGAAPGACDIFFDPAFCN